MEDYREEEDKELFNRISEKYAEKDIYPVSKLARAFQVSCMLDFLSTEYNMDRAANIIEVGCGHGAYSEYFKPAYVNYLGIDYSEELIKIASERYGNKNRRFVVDNVKEINKYGKFDLVIGVGILHHVDDIDETLVKLKEIGHDKTVYLFYEPQSGNPLIQALRRIRVKVDSSYSKDQVFFDKTNLSKKVNQFGFHNIKTRFDGYLTPPVAQVILKPTFLFMPFVKMLVSIDKFLFKTIDSRMAWNFIIAFTK